METKELWGLGFLGGVLRWVEELLVMVSGPVLTFALCVGLVALLTDGAILAGAPWLLIVWGVAMAVGVDGQLIGASVKCGRAFRAQKWGATFGYLIMIGGLGYVSYIAAVVFAKTQAEGITVATALHELGMDDSTWIIQRCLAAVLLVVLSGLLRYDPSKVAAESAESREARQQRELAEVRHKAAVRAAQVEGWRGVAETALKRKKAGDTGEDASANGGAFEGTNPVQNGTDGDGDTGEMGTSKPGTFNPRGRGQKAAPSNMMSAPQFRQLLAQNGVNITPERAVSMVLSVKGSQKSGTAYFAPKASLLRLANRLISETQSTGDADAERAG